MRKRVLFGSVYVPAINAERTGDDGDDDSDETDSEDGDNESNDKDELRQELLHEFSEVKDSDAEEIEQLFGDVIDEVRDEEDKRKLPGNKEDKDRFMLFESNHPALEIPENSDNGEEPMSETEKAHGESCSA